MSRMLVVCLVLALASVSYGDKLSQSWEDGGGNISSWGPTITGGQTFGATDGAMSVAIAGPVQWQWVGMVQGFPDAWGNTFNSVSFDGYQEVKFDVSVKGADWAGDNGC